MTISLKLILNTHMPYVVGRGALFNEPENWLFEAITETYIPLLQSLDSWSRDGFRGKSIILSLTPCLLEQLSICSDRYIKYLKIMRDMARIEVDRTTSLSSYNFYQKNPVYMDIGDLYLVHKSAKYYLERIESSIKFISENNLVDCFRSLAHNSSVPLELWTSTPYHNFLPFYEDKTIGKLIKRGVAQFRSYLGASPKGFWLPECAYKPGLENYLTNAGISRTALSLNALGRYHPGIKSGLYRYNGIEAYIQDFRLAMHIWQAPKDTIPSNPCYREFYRDVGLDVNQKYFDVLGIDTENRIKKNVWTGLKYHAISGTKVPLEKKSIYDWDYALNQVSLDVPNFLNRIHGDLDKTYDGKTCILAFDTEIFGHWWHEGSAWLKKLLEFKHEGLEDRSINDRYTQSA